MIIQRGLDYMSDCLSLFGFLRNRQLAISKLSECCREESVVIERYKFIITESIGICIVSLEKTVETY